MGFKNERGTKCHSNVIFKKSHFQIINAVGYESEVEGNLSHIAELS